jgi:hypothetical protein
LKNNQGTITNKETLKSLNNKSSFLKNNMRSKKEIDTLINLSRKVGQAFCDKDTFEEVSSKTIVQKWKYKDSIFRIDFPKNTSDKIAIESCYALMKMKLRKINLKAPSESSMRLVSNYAKVEELILLDELWEELSANDGSL